MAAQSHESYSALEQENAMLKSRLQACEQSLASLQVEVAQARAEAMQGRVDELAKNAALNKSIAWLANQGNINQFLERILLEIALITRADLAHLFVLREPERMLELAARVIDGELSPQPTPTEPPIYSKPFSADITPAFRVMEEQDMFLTLDMARFQPELTDIMWPGNIEWHLREGRQQCAALVLKAGDRSVGFLGLGFREKREFSKAERQSVMALADQASLAILLIQLAEEAKQAAIYEERNRMAREIHDTLAQAFTGISLQLEVAKSLVHEDADTVAQILDQLSQLADSGLTEARRSVWALYPPAAEYANLAQMLYESVEQMSSNTSTHIEVNVQGEPQGLPAFLGMNLLRIGQEALTNALQHGQAQTILIELVYEPDRLFLSIHDDGCGFTPPTTVDALNGGFGLMGMYERCDRIGAQMSINSQPRHGTQILVEVALTPAEKRL